MGSLLLALIYVCFISLGLPDSLLGSAWPSLHMELNVPVSYAGIISMVIAAGTILSSLVSDRLLRRFGAGKVTAFSILLTAVALFAYSASSRYWMLILWSIPYGLGCAPVYPCIIHMTPHVFGRENSQAMIAVQMASAYVGFLLMPLLFGMLAERISIALLPIYLGILLLTMFLMHETVVRKAK